MSEILNLILFYHILISVVVCIMIRLKIHELDKKLKENGLWREYYNSKAIFARGQLSGIYLIRYF